MYVTKQKPKRGFLIPLDIIRAASVSGITLRQMQEMVLHSTRITHPQGNRRYKQFLFMVEGNRVVAFGKLQDIPLQEPEQEIKYQQPAISVDDALGDFQCLNCQDTGKVPTFDECQSCKGVGCSKCDDGLVPAHELCTCKAADGFRTAQKSN